MEEITRFNDEFEYTFYDNGVPQRTIWIGPSNPYFCSFNAIPTLLTQAILSSEDGSFFVHHGFIKSSIRDALITDIKAGKMRRGCGILLSQASQGTHDARMHLFGFADQVAQALCLHLERRRQRIIGLF